MVELEIVSDNKICFFFADHRLILIGWHLIIATQPTTDSAIDISLDEYSEWKIQKKNVEDKWNYSNCEMNQTWQLTMESRRYRTVV